MMKQLITGISLVIAMGALHAAEVYRWVDEAGKIHYSDSPRPGAEAVEIREPNVYDAPENLPRIETEPPDPETDTPGYERLQITYPEPDSAFWDNQGNFTLRLTLEPALDSAAGHRVRVYLDGESQGTTEKLQWRFTGVNRGSHSVRAEVIDEAGESLIQSGTVSFHLHQQSVNLPARKANP